MIQVVTYNTQRLVDSGDNPKYQLTATQTLLGGKPAGLKLVIQEIEICKHCKKWEYHLVFSSDVVGEKKVVDSQWCIDYLNDWKAEKK
ncbi:hypothetical protein KY326_04200 [Candidatus Woesearchaeota archaeon]|nr:hypothetical protein [Candidatus Woesearchaeota archaeon]